VELAADADRSLPSHGSPARWKARLFHDGGRPARHHERKAGHAQRKIPRILGERDDRGPLRRYVAEVVQVHGRPALERLRESFELGSAAGESGEPGRRDPHRRQQASVRPALHREPGKDGDILRPKAVHGGPVRIRRAEVPCTFISYWSCGRHRYARSVEPTSPCTRPTFSGSSFSQVATGRSQRRWPSQEHFTPSPTAAVL